MGTPVSGEHDTMGIDVKTSPIDHLKQSNQLSGLKRDFRVVLTQHIVVSAPMMGSIAYGRNVGLLQILA
jgi:hypothetical protein